MNKSVVTLLIISFLVNILFGYHWYASTTKTEKQPKTTYPYLARRIFDENSNDVIINFVPLRQQLRTYVAEQPNKVGIYFEYLPTGVAIGVNDRESFFRASLVKIPAVMRAYKLIEEAKMALTDPLTLEEYHLDDTYGTLWQRGAGSTLTVAEAIKLTVVDSDNTAYEVLNDRINEVLEAPVGEERNISDVYDYLDIPRDTDGLTQEVTPRNYSSILRSLFFSAYLSYQHSDALLGLMDQSVYTHGIAGPIKDVKVAHKFGIRASLNEDLQVHSDCGIIYYPLRPYILCVMVEANESGTANSQMQTISQMIYEYVKSVNPNVTPK